MEKYENLSDEQVAETYDELLDFVWEKNPESRYDVHLKSGLSGRVTFKKGKCQITKNLPLRRQLMIWRMLLEKFDSRNPNLPKRDGAPIEDDEEVTLAIEETLREIRAIKPKGGRFSIPLINPLYHVAFNQTSSDVWADATIREKLQLLEKVWEKLKDKEGS